MTDPAPRIVPPKPKGRAERVSLLTYLRLFRRDILSAQPDRLFRARMAEFRTPFFRSFLVNEPALWRLVLTERPRDFPKSNRIRAGLEPLLGRSVFVTNGAEWERQRRIIDPAFDGGRLRDTLPAIWAAGKAAVARMPEGQVEVEAETSHAAADVIFRTLFSVPIEDATAQAVFHAFRAHQQTQPILNLAAFLPLPRWFPRLHRPATLRTARQIRRLITAMTEARAARIAAGTAPDDLATKIMTTRDPETGRTFATDEMVDQVAIFFLAGHETSASALAWTLYLIAQDPALQDRLADEAEVLGDPAGPPGDLAAVGRLKLARDVFREALRLYPPVPMMVRQATQPECFRDRPVNPGDQIVISPWHLGRHERLWDDPDAFCPARWGTEAGRAAAREGFIPFSTGPRVCTGAGFAMIEGPLLLAMLARAFRFAPVPGQVPEPVAQLTIRARRGILLRVTRRG
jgi:cytochrome P450